MGVTHTKTLPLRRRRMARTKADIQRCALELFNLQGFDKTTVAEIAEAADVSAMTVFRYFPTKEALVIDDDFDETLVRRLQQSGSGQDLISLIAEVLLTSLTEADDAARRDIY